LPRFLNIATWTLVLLASVLLHLGLLGVIVLAERRPLPPHVEQMEVELVPPPELPKAAPPKPESPKPEPPKPEPPKPEPPKPAAPPSAEPPAPQEQSKPAAVPPAAAPAPKPDPHAASGGPSESKSKLTPEEIAAFRAQVQKCWTLPIGLPDAMKLEAVLRVTFAPNGAIATGPELLKATASSGGPVLVGIAMKALRECAPFRLPAGKYRDWRVMDLRFLATGMTGLAPQVKPPAKPAAR
jgi:hypothetical protein